MEWWQQLNTGQSTGPRPGSIEALNAALQAQKSQAAVPKASGIDPRAWISEIGGTLGSIGGGIVGGPAGAAAGAAAGTSLGKVIEQKVKKEPVNVGNLAKEAGLSALFAYGPLRAAGKITGISATKMLGQAAETGASNYGDDLFRTLFNIQPTAKHLGKAIGPAKSDQLLAWAKANGIARGNTTANKAFVEASNILNPLGKQIRKQIGEAPIKSGLGFEVEKQTLKRELGDSFTKIIGGTNWKKDVIAADIVNKVSKAGSYADIWDILRNVSTSRNYQKALAAGSTETQQYLSKAYGLLSKSLKNGVSGYEGLAANYNIGTVFKNLVESAGRVSKIGPGKIGKVPILTGGMERGASALANAGQTKMNLAGQALQKLNPPYRQGIGISGLRALGPTGTKQLANQALKGATAREIASKIAGQQYGFTPGATTLEDTMMQGIGQPKVSTPQVQVSKSPYPLENLQYDIKRDPKNASKYLDYYQQLDKIFGVGGQQLQLSDTAIKNVNDVQKGLQDIVDLGSKIESSQGLVDPIVGRIRAANPYDVQARNLQSSIDRVRQVIGKALEGGVLRKEDEIKYQKILPTIYDNKQTALYKIQQVYQALTRDLNNYVGLQSQYGKGAGAPGTLEDTLLRLQSGGY